VAPGATFAIGATDRSYDAIIAFFKVKLLRPARMIIALMIILVPLLFLLPLFFIFYFLWLLKTTLLIKLRQIKRRITNWFAMNAEEMLASE